MAPAASAPREYPLRWTVEEYFGLVHRGDLRPDDRVELLDGLIVAMSPQNPLHAAAITRLTRVLQRVVGERAAVRVQLPMVLGRSAPEPDLALVPIDAGEDPEAHPRSAFLVVEVADSSLLQDRLTKAAIYARAGLPEYWLVNLFDDRIEMFRKPVRKWGRYRSTSSASRGERIQVMAFPDVSLAVEELLPAHIPTCQRRT